MGIVCPACGHTSQDTEFCDHCNGDLHGPSPAPALPGRCPVGAVGALLTPAQQAELSRPEAALLVNQGNRRYRVRWIAGADWPLWSASLRERLGRNALRCLPPVQVAETDAGVWVVAEATEGAFEPWASPLSDPHEECERLLHFVRPLANALTELHAHGLVWLPFDPRHLEQPAPGYLRFTNLDLGVYPSGQCPERLTVKPSFAAPEIVRYHPEAIGPPTDVFHLALFCYYWLAGKLPDGFPGEGLEAFWYELPKLRIFAPQLPPGIAGVLSQATAVYPTARHATPNALIAALEAAVERNRQRREFQGSVCRDLGAETRAGRTKTALGRDNEDCVLVRSFSKPDRALLAVADGITTCDVGSGALASLITTMVLENAFDETSTQATFATRISGVCRHGADTLLGWAVEKGYKKQLEAGADLMGTTLTVAWLEGNVLSLANLGDSRAYLIDEAGVEQLTVDGDLASGMLGEGMPPENLRDVGVIGKALRECVGGCTFNAKGDVTILENSCDPPVVRWPLVPGDVVILCSDGLVEENSFLEPETLAELVRANRHLSAQDLARCLVEAADDLHRLPSPLEPEGFGDNISCIVIKVM
jgi:serine/threonine protein phosphatase PrpC